MQLVISKLCNEFSFSDYEVKGHPVINRAKVPDTIMQGDSFNIYYGESSKGGVKWLGDIESSLLKAHIYELREVLLFTKPGEKAKTYKHGIELGKLVKLSSNAQLVWFTINGGSYCTPTAQWVNRASGVLEVTKLAVNP